MPGKGYNPLLGFDPGNPPPRSNNNEIVHQNFFPAFSFHGTIYATPTNLQLRQDTNICGSIPDSDTENINPPRHCTLRIFESANKPDLSLPWPVFKAYKAPTCLTMGELLEALGCNNKDSKKNILYEFLEGGGGRWSSGMVFRGDNLDRMSKRLDYFGWDETRDGRKNPAIWVWMTSEGF